MLRSCLATFSYKALWRSHMANLQHRAAAACQCWRMVASGRRRIGQTCDCVIESRGDASHDI